MKLKEISQTKLFELANIEPNYTGVSYEIWIAPKSGKEKHYARIKVLYKNQRIPFSIESQNPMVKTNMPSKKIEEIRQWIILNKTPLLKHWNKEITSAYFILHMKKYETNPNLKKQT
jgi:hypothetical protein